MNAKNILAREAFPRSSAYDPDWVMEHNMGPNALWLAEHLCEKLEIQPGDRVLDLCCGKALTSIFFAREFEARVWAGDLWVDPDGNWDRVCEAGMQDLVCPLKAEAHILPFAASFFDAITAVDGYQYFGTDALYLRYLTRFLKPGGQIGVMVPALMQEIKGEIPDHLLQKQANGQAFWEDECICFKTAAWWEELWTRSGCLDEVEAEPMPDAWKLWRDFENALEASGKNLFPSMAEALDADQGRYIGWVRVTARRKTQGETMNLYDPHLVARMGG